MTPKKQGSIHFKLAKTEEQHDVSQIQYNRCKLLFFSVNKVHLEACEDLTSFYGLKFLLYFVLLKIFFFF